MPDLDLGPDNYKIRDPRTGRWQTPANPRLALVMGLALIGVLIYLYIRRDEMDTATLFGVVAMFSFFAGGLLGLAVRKHY